MASPARPTRLSPPGRPSRHVTRYLHYAFGIIAGLLAAARTPSAERRRTAGQRWQHQWRRWVKALLHADLLSADQLAWNPLRKLLLGRTRVEISVILGPPPATSDQQGPATPSGYWNSEIWYYPLDPSRRHALAITFTNGIVSALDHLHGPGH